MSRFFNLFFIDIIFSGGIFASLKAREGEEGALAVALTQEQLRALPAVIRHDAHEFHRPIFRLLHREEAAGYRLETLKNPYEVLMETVIEAPIIGIALLEAIDQNVVKGHALICLMTRAEADSTKGYLRALRPGTEYPKIREVYPVLPLFGLEHEHRGSGASHGTASGPSGALAGAGSTAEPRTLDAITLGEDEGDEEGAAARAHTHQTNALLGIRRRFEIA